METPIKTSCIFCPIYRHHISHSASFEEDISWDNRVKPLNLFFRNEIKIQQILSKYKEENTDRFCDTFSSFEPLGVSILNDKFLERSERMSKSNKPRLVLFRYIRIKKYNMFAFLATCTDSRQFIFHMIDGYKGYLKCIQFLQRQTPPIIYLNWDPQNLLYKYEDSSHIIQNFSSSLTLGSDSKEEIVFKIGKYTPADYFFPIELHLVSYMLQHNDVTISSYKLNMICKTYIEKHPHIKKMSSKYAESYYNECVKSLSGFINKPTEQIVQFILKNMAKTWDLFSLSCLFINIIFGLKSQMTQCGFLDRLLKLLLLNTHPNFEKRKTCGETFLLIDSICNHDSILEDARGMLMQLNADSLIKVNQYLLGCNGIISSSFEARLRV